MSLPTLKLVCSKMPHVPAPLVRAVIKQLGGWDEDAAQNCFDISNFGIAGGFHGFIYYTDTVLFFSKNRKNILKLAESEARDFGYTGVLSFFASFNCMKDLDISETEIAEVFFTGKGELVDQVLNCLAWYAAETVAREIHDILRGE
ncbi:hypothetical protein EOL96_08215 [Candidatus Saccharibacteria bacterium]|nr:hypothetical protein [Candidatus Saccharibacteria bacterium]